MSARTFTEQMKNVQEAAKNGTLRPAVDFGPEAAFQKLSIEEMKERRRSWDQIPRHSKPGEG